MNRLKRIAVYAGTFDPVTNGHLWMIGQGVSLFDQLIVAIGLNPDKQTVFSLEERIEMIRQSTAKFGELNITHFTNQYLIHYAVSVEAQYILRGIRNENDFRYERSICNINLDIDTKVTTVFLTPPSEVVEVSSSMVKGLVGPEGWETLVAKYVPEPVLQKLKEKHHAK